MEMWVLKDEEVDNDVVDMCGDDKENLQKDHDVGKDDDKNKTVDLLDSDDTASTVILAESADGEQKNPSVVIIDHP